MVREAIIMLEVEGYVEVRKGSGIHVVSNQPRHQQAEMCIRDRLKSERFCPGKRDSGRSGIAGD